MPAPERAPGATVVVATRDRAADLRVTLPRHAAEVVVVDNGSTDDTPAVLAAEAARRRAAGEPGLRTLRPGQNLGATARNLGVAAARTEVVAFADDDSWWAPGSLQRAEQLFAEHPRLAVLAARTLVGPAEELDPVCLDMASAPWGRAPDLPGPHVTGFVACATVVRRDAFLATGGFDRVVHFGGEEERVTYDLLAAGWGLAYVDDVVAHHHPSPSRGTAQQRRELLQRNALLTAWMRRPLRVAARSTVGSFLAGGEARRGALAAVPRVPAALRQRRGTSPVVEERLAVRG
ncbi:glycosyltransferase family 2 protein [Kineococcus aurantiacus]|uniref:GT2 family glycosyltransferase n=1 Tax=Kineococcus aurantiacus TaxID=37633 RepID=A0A7Y9DN97_9ACTN|nr:glycosyltransferase family 2 protein [Kineococcus aurantiacus]NYD23742.1 GT2 family glycosyltransferase [Kineococcus aurantiacus]